MKNFKKKIRSTLLIFNFIVKNRFTKELVTDARVKQMGCGGSSLPCSQNRQRYIFNKTFN